MNWLWLERGLVGAVLAASVGAFVSVLWRERLQQVWPKVKEIRVVNPRGLWTGLFEVVTQRVVLRNRPWVGLLHLPLFFGLLAFLWKSVLHLLMGLGIEVQLSKVYVLFLDGTAVAVLISLIFLAVRRYLLEAAKLTEPLESGVILSLIAVLMVTHLLEHVFPYPTPAGRINWWVHYLDLAVFPAVIAHGKHLHLLLAPVNVILKHMTELPGDRPVFGNDLVLDLEDEGNLEAEIARLGMSGGVRDFSFGPLFDPAACIQCGRCNDACPAGPGLKPREHFVLALARPSLKGEELTALAPPEVVATCVQCRACEVACPTGCRPGRNGLEMRGRLMVEGLYPPRSLRDIVGKALSASGNIFGVDPGQRARFVESHRFPLYEPARHEVLFVLGCQGGNSPEVQPAVAAMTRLLDAAGVSWGVLEEERCWGEGLLHGGGLMEEWPLWAEERIEALTRALGGDRNRTILTVCPHCRDTIAAQYRSRGAHFGDVRLHVPFLSELVRNGRLRLRHERLDAALHLPCKVVHSEQHRVMEALLRAAGAILHHPATSTDGFPTSCCGGGGGGFLWDSPAGVNRKRWSQIRATGRDTVVTGCPGCHRMLGVVRDEGARILDVATVLAERLAEG